MQIVTALLEIVTNLSQVVLVMVTAMTTPPPQAAVTVSSYPSYPETSTVQPCATNWHNYCSPDVVLNTEPSLFMQKDLEVLSVVDLYQMKVELQPPSYDHMMFEPRPMAEVAN